MLLKKYQSDELQAAIDSTKKYVEGRGVRLEGKGIGDVNTIVKLAPLKWKIITVHVPDHLTASLPIPKKYAPPPLRPHMIPPSGKNRDLNDFMAIGSPTPFPFISFVLSFLFLLNTNRILFLA